MDKVPQRVITGETSIRSYYVTATGYRSFLALITFNDKSEFHQTTAVKLMLLILR